MNNDNKSTNLVPLDVVVSQYDVFLVPVLVRDVEGANGGAVADQLKGKGTVRLIAASSKCHGLCHFDLNASSNTRNG